VLPLVRWSTFTHSKSPDEGDIPFSQLIDSLRLQSEHFERRRGSRLEEHFTAAVFYAGQDGVSHTFGITDRGAGESWEFYASILVYVLRPLVLRWLFTMLDWTHLGRQETGSEGLPAH
jgi:hypothetical protein